MARSSSEGPITAAASVTPSDSTVLTTTRGLFIGGDGNIAVTMSDGANVTFTSVKGGAVYPFRVIKVLSTGTTATSIVALF